MRSSLKVSIVQAAPFPRRIARNIEYVRDVLRAGGAEVFVFPELFISGYSTENLQDLGLNLDSMFVKELSRECQSAESALVVGFVETLPYGRYSNSMLVIDSDGEVRRPVRKTHLFGAERNAFTAGDELAPIEVCGLQVGILNCFELEFPEVARTLRLKGARAFLAGSANMDPYYSEHKIATHARALENRTPLAYANRIGSESGFVFCGGSRVISADGAVLASLDHKEVGSVTAEIGIAEERSQVTDLIVQRRPWLYA